MGKIEKLINNFAYKMVDDLTKTLKGNITRNFMSCIYTGTPQIDYSSQSKGSPTMTRPKGEVNVIGEDASFIEFGTGVKFNGSVGSSPHEWANRTKPPALIGTYGQGKGKQQWWAFYGDDMGNDPNSIIHTNVCNGKSNGMSVIITRGLPAQYPIFNGYKAMKLYSQEEYKCKE